MILEQPVPRKPTPVKVLNQIRNEMSQQKEEFMKKQTGIDLFLQTLFDQPGNLVKKKKKPIDHPVANYYIRAIQNEESTQMAL